MKRLTTEDSLKPLVAQFVPIKIDVASDDYRAWTRDHKPSRNAIPQMFIVQANGEELFNQVGGLPAETLEKVLVGALSESGVTLSDRESETVAAAVAQATLQLEKDELFAAIETITGVPGAMDNSIRCFAEPVMKLREMVQQLTDTSSELISNASDRLDNVSEDPDERLELGRELIRLVDGVKELDPVQKERKKLESQVRKNSDMKRIVAYLKTVQSLIKSKSTTRELRLHEFAARYENTSLDQEITALLKNEGVLTGQWSRLANSEFRKWKSKNGGYELEARALLVSAESVRLEDKKGQMVSVNIKDLSEPDQSWLQQNTKR